MNWKRDTARAVPNIGSPPLMSHPAPKTNEGALPWPEFLEADSLWPREGCSLRCQPLARDLFVCKCLQVAPSPTRQGRFLQTHVCFYLSQKTHTHTHTRTRTCTHVHTHIYHFKNTIRFLLFFSSKGLPSGCLPARGDRRPSRPSALAHASLHG